MVRFRVFGLMAYQPLMVIWYQILFVLTFESTGFRSQLRKDTDRTKQICLWMAIDIYILPYPRGVEFSGEEVIVLPLAIIASLFVWIEVSATVERMYVNNINCDS